jgi:predicted peroxiredoxin
MKVTICGRTDEDVKDEIGKECLLREHTLSEAIDHILKLGLPLYLEHFPAVLKRVKKSKPTEQASAA